MKITEKEINILTGKEIISEREETAFEKEEREKAEAKWAEHLEQLEIKTSQRQAIADRLGLTAEELQILLG